MRVGDLRVHMEALARQSKGPQKTTSREELLAVVNRVAARTGIPVGTIQCKMPKGWLKMSSAELDSVMTGVARDAGGTASDHRVPVVAQPPSEPPPTRRRYSQHQALAEAAQLLESGYTAEEVRTELAGGSPSLRDLRSLQRELWGSPRTPHRKPIEEAADLLEAGWTVNEVMETLGTGRLSLNELRNLKADLRASGSSRRRGRRVVRRARGVSASGPNSGGGGARPSGVARSSTAADAPLASRPSAPDHTESAEPPTTSEELPELPPGWDDL